MVVNEISISDTKNYRNQSALIGLVHLPSLSNQVVVSRGAQVMLVAVEIIM